MTHAETTTPSFTQSDHTASRWQPNAAYAARSGARGLMQRLGLASYDELYDLSIRDPETFWRALNAFCGVAWAKPYDKLVDLSAGVEHPRWFPGGQLNWVETAFKWADHPAHGARTAIIAEHESGGHDTFSYAQLRDEVRAFAAGLDGLGVRRGERIGLLIEPGLEAYVGYLAIIYLGGIIVPLFSGYGVDATVARLAASQARVLIASTSFSRRGKRIDLVPLVEAAARELPLLETIIWKPRKAGDSIPGGLSFFEIAKTPPDSLRCAATDPNDPFLLIYTSGTTGKPKGAVHTHGSFALRILNDAAMHLDMGSDSVLFWLADMGWIVGSIVPVAALMLGATMVTYDGAPDFPDWSRMGRIVEQHSATHFGASPTLIRALAAHEEEALKGDTSTLQILITAGETIDAEHFSWFHAHFGRGIAPVLNYTGGTEVSGALLTSTVLRPIDPGSFNTPSLGVPLDIVDVDTGRALTGEVGDLVIRGPFIGMTQSFWNDDERYLDAYWRRIPGVWVHGDLAFRDAEGFFYIRGRADDTLKVAGKRLGPAEVEEAVLELETVEDAAAVGVEDAATGQRIVVFAVPGQVVSGREADRLAESIKAQVARTLGRPFQPSEVLLVEQLPRTRSSKVMRRVIRNLYDGKPLGDLSSLENPASIDAIRRALRPMR
ncbi:AMP-binding protein [Castellaniella sp. S9]|uniref:AMP-binding protein n=1 Tax=Castellaniella sp. S9 TaxID=2993652 RepID=UPI0022B3E217|nr:AMP-binding protein [Castellaniella sp. S9]